MKILSLFSGIGAFEKALDRLEVNYELVNYCEIDKYASKAYSMMHDCDESLNLGDITKIDTTALPNDIDLITYGFPCQDISLAGKQKGFEEDGERTRSGLFFEALRIIEDTKPRIAIAENVKNLVSKKFSKEFDIVLSSLEETGYNNYWKILNAKDYGIPQNRERVFIVSIRKDIDNGMFKFPEGFELEFRLKDMLEDGVDEKYYISNEMIEYISAKGTKNFKNCDSRINLEVARPLTTDQNKRAGTTNYLSDGLPENFDLSAIDIKAVRKYGIFDTETSKHQAGSVWDQDGLAPTLDTMQGGYRQPCIEIREKTKRGYKEAYEGDGVYLNRPHQKRGVVQNGMIQTLKTSCSDVGVVVSDKPICVGQVSTGNSQAGKVYSPDGVSQTLCAGIHGYAMGNIEHNLRIRKLTPLECFRLMGFDDEDFNKITGISNTQLYKQAGNSIVVDVLVHLFESLFKALESNKRAEIIKQPTLFDLDKEEEFMEEKQKLITNENMIKWNEIDDLIGKPVFDKNDDAWRILDGYKRIKKDYFVSFTDSDEFEEVDLNRTNLYRNEELAYKK
ncbi:DNA cytosine methyltransferase [Thomasclavelia ramosa]|uniref:DNA cytosine methyltransferase n=1 Tax=Thomasclavelia ramosa TaxID=1547 RepID=UPI001E00B4E5|nr:DNA cytosine methyltransferase [Thomasclavelia ramosa]MBS5941458.1 DNA cytosine methyltransferase [Ligilactobacillus salivarius]MCM1647321.1 DNA cytosine methyltransferase [Thomasclavelia ramosa]